MLQKIKNAIVLFMTAGTLLVPIAVPVVVSATVNSNDIQGSLCSGSNINVTTSSNTTDCTSSAGTGGLNTLLSNVIKIFSAVVGVIAVIMLIVGGFRYITSGGESGKVGSAKNTLIYAIVGLIIVALAQLVVHFVLGQASTISNSGGSAN